MKWTKDKLIEFETKVKELFEEGKINCPLHLCGGNEDTLISLFSAIKKKDWVVSTHRNHYHYLLKGGTPDILLAEIMGKKEGCCGGKGRSMHIFDSNINFISSAIVAGGCAIAVGIALGIKKSYKGRQSKPHVWCFVGDGGEDAGRFVEAVRFGYARQLPLTFVIEDNDLSIESSKQLRWHNYLPLRSPNVVAYDYKRKYPHVGVGKWVTF